MEIAELILLLRNEVQRSYDLIEDSVSDNNHSGVYINVEKMEIDIPIQMSASQKQIDVEELKKKSFTIQKFELPFHIEAMDKLAKSTYLKSLKSAKMSSNSIQIEVVNQTDKKDSQLQASMIGRLRLILQPVVK